MTIVHRSTQKSIQEAKHAVVLDVDNTLTPPRRPLEAEMASALRRLTIPFFLGAGGDLRLVFEQFIEPLHNFGYRGSFDAFLCNGSTRYHCELFEKPCAKLLRGFEMRQHLGENRFLRLMEVIEATLNLEHFRLPPPMHILGERIIDRCSMINVAPIGRPNERLSEQAHANRIAFKQYDELTGFRKKFLTHLTRELSDFAPDGLYMTLGGETSFDIGIEGNDKSFPLHALLNEGFQHVWYVGDALFEDGNDASVLKFIEQWRGAGRCPVEAIPVESWRDTISVLNNLGIVNGNASLGAGCTVLK